MNYVIKPEFDTDLLIAFKLGTIAPGSALNGLVYDGVYGVTGAPASIAGVYIPGATVRNAVSGVVYRNSDLLLHQLGQQCNLPSELELMFELSDEDYQLTLN